MKSINIKKIFSLFIVVVLVTACAEKLDKLPPQSISTEIALNTSDNVKLVLQGAYDALSNSNLFGGEVLRNSELLAADDEVAFTGTFEQPGEIWNKAITTTNSDVSEMWLNAYNTINIINNVLSALDIVDEADRDVVEGEARFIRGLIYFELVKFFALPYSTGGASANLGVPLVLTPTKAVDATSQVARNTVEEVYQQVINDLSIAITNLPPANREFANSVAAGTVLARVDLQMGLYPDALTAANDALNAADGNYVLTSTYDGAFNRETNSFEDIFSIQVTTQDGFNAMQVYYASTINSGRGDMDIQQKHLDFYTNFDVRGNGANGIMYEPDAGAFRTLKWVNQFANVLTIRLAELYLIRAECNVRLNQSVGDTPTRDLNQTRSRAGLSSIANPTLLEVLLERKLELAHEGQAIHDFKRTQGLSYQLPDALGNVGDGLVDGFAYDANELVYPIPDREMNVNKKLVQNPGYSGN